MGAFSSSCTILCNEGSFMSVRRSRVTLVQTKAGEHWEGAGQHWDGSHSGRSRPRNGDSVCYFHRRFSLPVSAWAALQIQALGASWDPLLDSNKRKQGPCSVENKTFARFSPPPSAKTPEATTLSQTAQRREARTTTWSITSDRLGWAAALNPIDRCYSARKNLRSDTHWIAVT